MRLCWSGYKISEDFWLNLGLNFKYFLDTYYNITFLKGRGRLPTKVSVICFVENGVLNILHLTIFLQKNQISAE